MTVDRNTVRIWHVALCAMVLYEGLLLARVSHSGYLHSGAISHGLGEVLAQSWLLLFVLEIALASCVWRFCRAGAHWGWGFGAFASLRLLFAAYAAVYSVRHQQNAQLGAAFLGFVAGYAYAHAVGIRASHDESGWHEAQRYGGTGAIAMFAATYMSAGSSKLINSHLAWAQSPTIRLMALGHAEVGLDPAWHPLQHFVAYNAYAGQVLEIATIIVQLGAWVYLVGPRARIVWGTLCIGLHVGIMTVGSITFSEAILTNVLFAYPWADILRRAHVRLPATNEHEAPPEPDRALLFRAARWGIAAWGAFLAAIVSWRMNHRPF